MRKVVSSLFVSIDGVVEAPDQWQFDVFDEDMGAAMVKELATLDAVLLGRVTYEEWASYWPNYPTDSLDAGFATFINNAPKYVVSNTLNSVGWGQFNNAHLIKGGDLVAELAKIKAMPGKNIGVNGSPTLVRRLLLDGLLDRLTLLVHPVVAAYGKRRLFNDGDGIHQLKLVDHSVTGSGVALLTYEPR